MASRFPWWIIIGAAIITAGYLPTLRTPFDFIDDGNLVYPAPVGTVNYASIWWEKVRANYDHLGPFRPTLWFHWELFANLFNGHPLAWRIERLLWCGVAAGTMLWFFRELNIPRLAAFVATTAAMWNPYRNEIWTSLTLAEGVAMPYALLALIAAKRGSLSTRAWVWDFVALFGLTVALGCKNTFVALIPPMVILRMLLDGKSWQASWRTNGWRSFILAIPVLFAIVHFVYFKLHWHPGQYETHGPSWDQAIRILKSLKGAISFDFMIVGYVITVLTCAIRTGNTFQFSPRFLAALTLVISGMIVYLPMEMMSGRYSMPAVWGLDILFAVLLKQLLSIAPSFWTRLCWIAIVVGLSATCIANLGRQDKFTARAKLLDSALQRIAEIAPKNASIAWYSGNSLVGELDREEGIHFYWHLQARGRNDITLQLFDAEGKRIVRPELPRTENERSFKISHSPITETGWSTPEPFESRYWFGQKSLTCFVSFKIE